MNFNIPELADGIGFVVIAMGVFGFAEVLRNLEVTHSRDVVNAKITGLMPTREDLKQAAPAVARGTILGSILGILPGGGSVIAAFAAYTLEKKLAKDPRRFGRGAIEGVAGPETRQQRGLADVLHPAAHPRHPAESGDGADGRRDDDPRHRAGSASDDQAARPVLGHDRLDVVRQPDAADHQPAAGRSVGPVCCACLTACSIPMILIFCCIGVYSVNNAPADVFMTAGFALVGYWLVKHDFEPAPMLLGFVLGPLMEENLRRAMLIARGDWTVFLTRPISGGPAGAVGVPAGGCAAADDPRKARRGVRRGRLIQLLRRIANLISGGVFMKRRPNAIVNGLILAGRPIVQLETA